MKMSRVYWVVAVGLIVPVAARAQTPVPAGGFSTEPDRAGLSPEAIAEYDSKFLTVNEAIVVRSGDSAKIFEMSRGKYRNPIGEADFLRLVGHPEQAEQYLSRRRLGTVLLVGGATVLLGGMALGLAEGICHRGLSDPRFAADCVDNRAPAVILVTTALTGIALGGAALFINPHPFTPPELARLADEYNQSLRRRLLSAPAAARPGPTVGVAPYLGAGGGGLAVSGNF